MTWYKKMQIINNGLNEAVNLLHKYINHQKFFLDPEHLECGLVCTFFTESRLAAWRFLKLTIRVEPSFYKPIMTILQGVQSMPQFTWHCILSHQFWKLRSFSTTIHILIYLRTETLQYFSICCLLSFLR